MRAAFWGMFLVACSSNNDRPPQPTTPCGKSIAVIGGAIEATLTRPDAESFRMAAKLVPERDCDGVPELIDDWFAYLEVPAATRRRELLLRLDELATQHRWIPGGSLAGAIREAKRAP